ncbi:DUF1499 domain-containing protein [Nitratireductor basaltis]|uniref:DUF1499 domain-containing protein n=1 Tax=Nitratireductor basaltis TaxID=472175 RepID=A0A084UCN9_9HYPH|nr:DUF1499 domain-containing protein [Nitratireductor basaltis]KFB10725.1 hypothetical protein EL18_01765 [Nitratireductor basaltis]
MVAIIEQRYAPAAYRARGVASFALVLAVSSALAHRYDLVETLPFLWLIAICGLLGLTGLVLAISGFVQMWQHGWRGLGAATLGLFLSVLVLVPYGVSLFNIVTNPQLVDISTDLQDPPEFQAAERLRDADANPVTALDAARAERIAKSYPDITGRRYEFARESVEDVLDELIADRGWKVTARGGDPAVTTIEAVAKSYLLGFDSDVVIRIEDQDNATFVDMRSASRYGSHDMGENAERIRRFLTELDKRLQELTEI